MKKGTLLVGILIIFSLVLAACSTGEDTVTPASTSSLGLATQDADGLPGTGATAGATTAATAQPSATAAATEAPTMSATEAMTGTADATAVPDTGSMAGGAILLSDLLQADIRMSGMSDAMSSTPAATEEMGSPEATTTMGEGVLDGESIGSIRDIILDLCGGDLAYVIVDASADLVGEEEGAMLVPYDALKWVSTDEDSGHFTFVGNVSSAILQGAPTIDLDVIDFSTADWDREYRNYWSSEIEMDSGSTAGCAFASGMSGAGSMATESPDDSGMMSTETAGSTGISDNGWVLASELIGWNVLDNAGVDLGEVNDAIVLTGEGMADTGSMSASSTAQATGEATAQVTAQATEASPSTGSSKSQGDLRYIVIGAGGLLGIGESNIPVPPSALSYDEGTNSLMVNLDQDTFSSAPSIDLDELDSVNWDLDIDEYWVGWELR